MAQRLDPQFPERSSKGPHLNAGFQKGRNNNPLCDVFHMRSVTLNIFFFLQSETRRQKKQKDKSKVSSREEKVRKDLKFQSNLGSQTNG